VGAPAPCPADGGAAQSRGRVGAAQSRARSWCAQHSADQEKWRLPLGILSGGRVRECMGQLMGWQKMGQMAHVMFFFIFSFLFYSF
jgi:hypothetical protein